MGASQTSPLGQPAMVGDKGEAGRVFDIQRASIHDGPGIRTTVFLKGCFLHCAWCHNPESIDPRPQIMYHQRKCIGCLACFDACRHGSLRLVGPDGSAVVIADAHSGSEGLAQGLRRAYDPALCVKCGACVEACYAEALEMVGRTLTVEDVCLEVERDRAFYDNSGGGVTVSGGEPLLQWEFTRAILATCHGRGIHTALDTTAYGPWERVAALIQFADMVLLDLKCMDDRVHRRYTGVSHATILKNARHLATEMASRTVPDDRREAYGIWVRIPIVPGVNDDDINIARTGEFIRDEMSGAVRAVELLAYHRLGESKVEALGQSYALMGLETPPKEEMTRLANAMARLLDGTHIEVRWR